MRLPPFELSEPRSLAEAVEAFAAADGEARLIAGGTALVPMMRLGLVKPARLIALHRVGGLSEISAGPERLSLGAMVTMADLERAPAVRARWPLLAEAAGRVATPAVRSAATLGGNLGYAEAASDPAPALLCLDAIARIAGPAGERSLPISGLFTGFYETAIGAGEILIGVDVPACPPGAVSAYVKFCSRSAEDKPLVGVAALLIGDGRRGRCREARIALAGVAPTAIRCARAEARLRDQVLDDAAVRAAAETAAGEADPLSDLMGSADYRREMVRVWVRRLLEALRAR
ncbi:MAG TPA: xanthine dehydrogenase family protein subunit M [Candidatus Methylomirabilis sp.]|nr:xanthine dehydrogenase family protein subunit M [Candidatus Methylomirabilis sp.]